MPPHPRIRPHEGPTSPKPPVSTFLPPRIPDLCQPWPAHRGGRTLGLQPPKEMSPVAGCTTGHGDHPTASLSKHKAPSKAEGGRGGPGGPRPRPSADDGRERLASTAPGIWGPHQRCPLDPRLRTGFKADTEHLHRPHPVHSPAALGYHGLLCPWKTSLGASENVCEVPKGTRGGGTESSPP